MADVLARQLQEAAAKLVNTDDTESSEFYEKVKDAFKDIFGLDLEQIPILGDLFEALDTAFGQVLDLFQGLVITPINEAIGAVKDWFANLLNYRQTTTQNIDANTAAIANLNGIAPTSPVTPAYVADINDMATCARDDLNRWSITGSTASDSHNHGAGSYDANTTTGDVTGSSSSDSHDHGAGTLVASIVPAVYAPARVVGTAASPVDYTPIVVDRAGRVKNLRWRVGNDPSIFGINAYSIALCVYNPATLAIEKVWDSGNIRDGVANTSSLQEVAVNMGLTQDVTPGQILFVAHQQIASGLVQATRSYACKLQSGSAARPGQLLDAWYFRTPGNYAGIPSTVTLASLSRRNDCIPWAAVSVDSTVTP